MRALLVVAPILFTVTACLSDGAGALERVGLVAVRSFNNSGTPVVRASAVFYRAPGLGLNPVQLQECALFPYSPVGTGDNAGATINAGTNVSFTIGAFTELATPAIGSVFPVYNFTDGSYLDFVGGDSVLVTIPGAEGGFEAMSVKARLAEPFTADTLPEHVDNTPMNLTWQPATAPGSIMVVSLRFNSAPGATSPNVEVACAVEDDGSTQVPAAFASAYATADAASRDHAFIRIRDRIVEFDSRTRTRVRSIYEYPATSLVDAP